MVDVVNSPPSALTKSVPNVAILKMCVFITLSSFTIDHNDLNFIKRRQNSLVYKLGLFFS